MKQISLKAARINTGLTQKEAAKEIGVSAVTIVNWESGKTEPSPKKFRRVCEVYGFEERDIFLP